jgi:hypothetical protein
LLTKVLSILRIINDNFQFYSDSVPGNKRSAGDEKREIAGFFGEKLLRKMPFIFVNKGFKYT